MIETSAAGSDEITRAGTSSLPRNSTMICSIACTTWAAVMTLPSSEMSAPAPVSLNRLTPPVRAETLLPAARITATDGSAFLNTSRIDGGACAQADVGTPTATLRANRAATGVRIVALLLDGEYPAQ